jgi:excisionase family DNA binding protein
VNYLTIPTAALAAGVHHRTIRRWIAQGLPVVRLKGKAYIHRKHLDEWLFANTRDVS